MSNDLLSDDKAINNWFDVRNRDHVLAWRHLQKTGCWPKGFIPEDVTMPTSWAMAIYSKLADAYVEDFLK